MIAIKDFGMPSCCMNCEMFRVLDGEVAPRCVITGHIIGSSDEYLDKRADDCPLVEIEQPEDCVGRKAVIDNNEIQIITGGRLNGRTYAYKCGQQNMKVLMIKKIKEARTKIKNSIEPIVGTYNRETPERDWPSYKIQRNKGREDALEILDKLIEGMN